MPFISDTFQQSKLAENNVTIKTTYIADGRLLCRSTDGADNEDIRNGIRCRKEYFLEGKLAHIEKLFDSRIEYTFVSNEMTAEPHTCANCGFGATIKAFEDGCPYCGAASNIDYTDKDLGGKHHYDLVLKNPLYRIITAVVDYVFSLLLAFLFIVFTSRTFNGYDLLKVFLYGTILSALLYYLFYICDAYVVLGPIRRFKAEQNRKQMEFWKRTGIDQQKFFNNLNYEVSRKLYAKPGVIDYDIIDYTDFREYEKEGELCVDVTMEVRLVTLRNHRISSGYRKETITLRKNHQTIKLRPGMNSMKCPNCDANVDVTKGFCEYCDTKLGGIQEWTIPDGSIF